MIKLLAILTPSLLSPMIMQSTDMIISSKKQKDAVVILDEIQLNQFGVNVYNLAQGEFDQMRLFSQMIVQARIANPQHSASLLKVLTDINKNNDDWLFLDFPLEYPQIGQNILTHVTVLYMGSGEFFGILDFNCILKNEDPVVKENLGDQFKIFNLGEIENISSADNVINQIFIKNPKTNVTRNDIEIVELTYQFINVKAKPESQYTGNVTFNFKSTFSISGDGTSPILRVNAYNSTQNEDWYHTIKFRPFLGKDEFLKIGYTNINYVFSGYTWDNDEDQKDEFEDIKSGIGKTVGETEIISSPIALNVENGNGGIYHREYVNVNKMKSDFSVNYGWEEETFEIEFHLNVYAYATAWNAYWARTESSVSVYGFKFV